MNKRFFLKKVKGFNWFGCLFLAMFLAQLLVIVYFNLATLAEHMGYDSSWSYLKAALMWREKSLNSPVWADQTNVFFDSSLPLAALIYGITGKLFASYGIANLLVLGGMLLCIWKILSLLQVGRTPRLVAMNLLLCPYLTNEFNLLNDLGYFNDVLSGPAFYSVRALLMLLVIYEFLAIRRKGKIDIWGYAALVLCVIAGASSGIFILVMAFFPYLLYEGVQVLADNDWRHLKSKESLYAYLGCGCVVAGKILAKVALGIEAIDTSRTWTSLERLWTNMGAVIQGFLKLLGVLPVTDTDISVLSEEGIWFAFPILIVAVILLSLGYAIKKIKSDAGQNRELLFLLLIIGVNLLVFGLFNAQYGSVIFEERYLITTFMTVILVVAYYMNQLEPQRIFSKVIYGGMFLALLGTDYVSDVNYAETTNAAWQMEEIAAVVEAQDAELVYVWGDELRVVGRAMRAYDLDHVYKVVETSGVYHHWGDYLYYEKNEDYTGSTLLIVPRGAQIVPGNIMDRYTLLQELETVSIYVCDHNPVVLSAGAGSLPSLGEEERQEWEREQRILTFVDRLYTEVLNCAPDPEGRTELTAALMTGEKTGVQVAEEFLMRPEFTEAERTNEAYVQMLYRVLFDREADAEGLLNWSNALNNGATEEFVFSSLANSEEFENLCKAYGMIQGSIGE